MFDDKKKEIVISRVRAKRANSFGFSCDLGLGQKRILIFIPLNFSVAKKWCSDEMEGNGRVKGYDKIS
jgi:hypothetical protein